MRKSVIFTIIVLVFVGLGYAVITQINNAPQPPVVLQNKTTPSPAADPFTDAFTASSPEENPLLASGNRYADPAGNYTFLYPSDYKLDTQDPLHTRIYKTGATQRGQTEMYDGVIIVFENIDLQGKTLEAWVDAHIQEYSAEGTVEVTQPKKSIALQGQPGFTFTTRSLGETTTIVVQKNAQSQHAVSISMAVNDPQQVGYQTEVNTILDTLQLQK